MSQETAVPTGTEAIGGFDALRILDYEFTVTAGGNEHTFETQKDEAGLIISVNGGFDALRILDYEFTVTAGGREHTFETQKDEAGRIISVNGNGKDREITYGADTEMASSFAGVEYEQTEPSLPDLISPVINDVTIDTMDPAKGIYKLSVSKSGCTLDSRAVPFFFFTSWEGVFEKYAAGANASAAVIFKANPGTGERSVRVTVGVGDGLGQIYRESILLKGAL